MATDDKLPPPLPPTLTEAQIERFVSLMTQGVLEMKRNARLLAANQQLDARAQMRQVDAIERIEKQVARLVRMENRPPSLTVVQDVPSGRNEDITSTFMLGQPWVGVQVLGKRIPSKWVARFFVVGCVVFGALMVLLGMGLVKMGVTPSQVVKTAAPLVAP